MDTRQHIVVVEDEPAQRQLLLDYLTKQGFRVTGFESGVGLRRMVERGYLPFKPAANGFFKA